MIEIAINEAKVGGEITAIRVARERLLRYVTVPISFQDSNSIRYNKVNIR